MIWYNSVTSERKENEMKPCTDAKHFKLEAYRQNDEGQKSTILYYDVYCDLHEAARIMTDVVIRELHDGDGENGGSGSLKNCYGEIFNCFMCGHQYGYADCVFFITPILHVDDYFAK